MLVCGTSTDEIWPPVFISVVQGIPLFTLAEQQESSQEINYIYSKKSFVKFVNSCLWLLGLYCHSESDCFCQSWSAVGGAHTSMALLEIVQQLQWFLHPENIPIISFGHQNCSSLNLPSHRLFP